MRLIDADALKEHISSYAGMFTDEGFMVNLQAVLNGIDFAPTIDAVPVIRCKNCKHFAEFRAEAKKDGADGTCRRLLMKVVENDFSSVRATDFCSYGERKE